MAKMVGLSRNLKEPWLNKVAELAIENLTEDEVKNQLNEYLGFEIGSPTNLRKTRMNILKSFLQKRRSFIRIIQIIL